MCDLAWSCGRTLLSVRCESDNDLSRSWLQQKSTFASKQLVSYVYYIHVAGYTQLFIYNNSYSEISCVLPSFFNLHLVIFKIRKIILVSYTYITTITVMIFSYHIKLLSMNDLKEKLSIYLSEQSVIFALSYKLYT